jgi:UDP-glucose 4-epimerase
MTKVLVTGGGGFIGSNLVRALLERGDEVRVLDNFSTGNRANLEGLDVDVVEGELRSYERVHNAVRGTELVFHLGALGSVRRVVFSSSSSVYGTRKELPVTEGLPLDPLSPYGVAKLAAERYCISFSRVYERFESVVVRYFNVFGPWQSPFSQYAAVIPKFITAISAGRAIEVYGDGEQSRDFTYVDNVIAGTILAAEVPDANGYVFNIAASAPTTVNHVADLIGRILGTEVQKNHTPPRPGDIRDSWADVTAARELLGWTPTIDLEQGLRRTVAHILDA